MAMFGGYSKEDRSLFFFFLRKTEGVDLGERGSWGGYRRSGERRKQIQNVMYERRIKCFFET